MKRIRNEQVITLLGKRIRALRKQQNISQAQLAFEAGVPRVQIGRIERGVFNPTISSINAIANALEVGVKELFDFEK